MKRNPTCRRKVVFFDDDDFVPSGPGSATWLSPHFHEFSEVWHAPEHGTPDLEIAQLSFQLAQTLPDLDFLHGLLRHQLQKKNRPP